MSSSQLSDKTGLRCRGAAWSFLLRSRGWCRRSLTCASWTTESSAPTSLTSPHASSASAPKRPPSACSALPLTPPSQVHAYLALFASMDILELSSSCLCIIWECTHGPVLGNSSGPCVSHTVRHAFKCTLVGGCSALPQLWLLQWGRSNSAL